MTLRQLSDFISQVGFPVFVAIVLLWRLDRSNAQIVKGLEGMCLLVERLQQCMDSLAAEIRARR